MKNTLLLAAACLLFQNVFAQTTEVKNLHYKYHESSYNRKGKLVEDYYELNFNAQGDTLLAEKKRREKNYPIYFFDFSKKAVITIMHNRRDYIVDEIDSSFRSERKLLPTGRKEVIDGFNCSEYILDTTTETSYHQKEGTYNIDPVGGWDFVVWITEDLNFNPNYNPYVMALLKLDHQNIVSAFNGVVVRMESGYGKWDYVITLQKDSFDERREVPLMPWLAAEPGAAMLPGPSAGKIKSPSDWDYNLSGVDGGLIAKGNRMEEFLYKIVGHKNIKTRGMYFFDSWW